MRPHLYAILLAGCLLGLAQTLPHPQEEGEGEEQEQEEGSDGATEGKLVVNIVGYIAKVYTVDIDVCLVCIVVLWLRFFVMR